jgi:hypothetical protein
MNFYFNSLANEILYLGDLINFEIWYNIWIGFTIKVSLNLNGRIKIQKEIQNLRIGHF